MREHKLYDDSIEVFKQYLRNNSKDIMAYKELAFTFFLMEKFDEAVTYIDVSLKINDKDAYSHFTKGQILLGRSEFKEAINEFKIAIELKPTNNTYFNQLGLALIEVKEYDEAIQMYQKAYEIQPKVIYMNNQADAYIKSGKHEKALEILNQIIEKEADYGLAYSNISNCYEFLKNYDLSLININKAIELEPENTWFLIERGYLHLDCLSNKKEALNDFNKAYEKSLKGLNIGSVFITQDRYKKTLDLVKLERIKLNKLLSDVDAIHEDISTLIEKMEEKDAKRKLQETLKELQSQTDKVNLEEGISNKIDLAEMIKLQSEKLKERLPSNSDCFQN